MCCGGSLSALRGLLLYWDRAREKLKERNEAFYRSHSDSNLFHSDNSGRVSRQQSGWIYLITALHSLCMQETILSTIINDPSRPRPLTGI